MLRVFSWWRCLWVVGKVSGYFVVNVLSGVFFGVLGFRVVICRGE